MWVKKTDICLAVKPRIYGRTSMARTLMARLPWLFRTLSSVPRKKNLKAADLGLFRVVFYFILKMVYCVYSLESHQ